MASEPALACFPGISRPTKDLDVFCKPSDAPKILGFFKQQGYRIEIEDERWIGKVWKDENFFDVIYNISTASIPRSRRRHASSRKDASRRRWAPASGCSTTRPGTSGPAMC